jgi:membrane-bound lytic murein transglycosylase B
MSRVPAPNVFSLSRRRFTLGASALLLSATASPGFAAGVSGFVDATWKQAKARGVSKRIYDIAMSDFQPLPQVVKLSGTQPEVVSTAGAYVSRRVTDSMAGTGRDMRAEWTKTLAAVGTRYGVQPEVVLAIWGIETNFGRTMGGTNTVHGLATLAYSGYRAEFFGNELLTALDILQAGHVAPNRMIGSWAGAMGHPQFMPSSFTRYAVDFDGDGHKDIWTSVPDAQASTANYLNAFGWRPGETWGYEVKLPPNFNYNNVWSGLSASLADWRGAGVVRANGKPFPRDTDMAKLYMPMGGNGPVFAVLPNFGVIKRYNNSDSYALAVGHLADRIIGGGSFLRPWPDDTALNKADRVQLQSQLTRRGYQIGSADGVVGPKTRSAVMDFQNRAGLLADGHVSGNLLRALG